MIRHVKCQRSLMCKHQSSGSSYFISSFHAVQLPFLAPLLSPRRLCGSVTVLLNQLSCFSAGFSDPPGYNSIQTQGGDDLKQEWILWSIQMSLIDVFCDVFGFLAARRFNFTALSLCFYSSGSACLNCDLVYLWPLPKLTHILKEQIVIVSRTVRFHRCEVNFERGTYLFSRI